MSSGELRLFTAIGPRLTHWSMRSSDAQMIELGSFTLPANVQYAWPHPVDSILYVASSNGGTRRGPPGDRHHLTACRVSPTSGEITALGKPIVLPSRPIHVTTDPAGQHALLAFNQPAAVRVYTIRSDGSPGSEVVQPLLIDAGNYPHQVRLTTDGKVALSTALGQNPSPTRAEDPGSINLFEFVNGKLCAQQVVAPGAGLGFGPRHLDIHPDGRWVYVSLERQNRLDMFELSEGSLSPTPIFSRPLLSRSQPTEVRQHGGAVHVHPSGRFVYGVNRAWQSADHQGTPILAGGENTLAVFEIDPETGAPTCMQHVDTRGIHCRTFAIAPDGRTLIAAHIMGMNVMDGQQIVPMQPGLSIFRISDNGRLAFEQFQPLNLEGASLFWMGMSKFQQ